MSISERVRELDRVGRLSAEREVRKLQFQEDSRLFKTFLYTQYPDYVETRREICTNIKIKFPPDVTINFNEYEKESFYFLQIITSEENKAVHLMDSQSESFFTTLKDFLIEHNYDSALLPTSRQEIATLLNDSLDNSATEFIPIPNHVDNPKRFQFWSIENLPISSK